MDGDDDDDYNDDDDDDNLSFIGNYVSLFLTIIPRFLVSSRVAIEAPWCERALLALLEIVSKLKS